jgi:galactonate dehydratase
LPSPDWSSIDGHRMPRLLRAMNIKSFEVHRIAVDERTRWVMLKLIAADGQVGWGEALLADDSALGVAALTHAAQQLCGTKVLQAAAPTRNLAIDQATGLLEATVHATVDQCLWDLRARLAGLPVHRLVGPTLRTRIKLYANINRGTVDRSPQGFAQRATAALSAGFDAVKIAPFDGVSRAKVHTASGRADLDMAIRRVHAVRDAIGESAMLLIDCHCRLDLVAARRFLHATRETRIDWFEDVLPYHDLDGWAHLRGFSDAPLAGGETARGVRDLLPFIERGLWDVLMPDVRFFGGITELVSLASIAAQHQLSIAPHNPRGPVATLASAHAMAGCAVFHMLEYQFDECVWRNDLVDGAEVIDDDGHLMLPNGPGLGCTLNQALLDTHRLS